jgi:HD superfamily phosphohydrolase
MCDSFQISGNRKEVVRAAALLHDIGHGPFSHLFEDIMRRHNAGNKKFSHEEITEAIIKHDPEIVDILRGTRRTEKGRQLDDILSDVLDLFAKKPADTLAKSIISSSIDADKMDYLRRDSYHSGTVYGVFDLERIFATLRKKRDNATGQEYPAVLQKGVPALESFRLARYLLYTQVYQHHTRIVADRMFLRSLETAVEEGILPKTLFVFRGREKKFLNSYLSLDDSSIYDLVLRPDRKSIATEIMSDLKARRLFKRCYVKDQKEMDTARAMDLWQQDNKVKLKELEQSIATELGIDQEFVIAYGESEVDALKSYRNFGTATQAGDIPMLYIDSKGKSKPYEDVSPIRIKEEPSITFYVFTKDEKRTKGRMVCDKILGK